LKKHIEDLQVLYPLSRKRIASSMWPSGRREKPSASSKTSSSRRSPSSGSTTKSESSRTLHSPNRASTWKRYSWLQPLSQRLRRSPFKRRRARLPRTFFWARWRRAFNNSVINGNDWFLFIDKL
jgi:hypothetical protein